MEVIEINKLAGLVRERRKDEAMTQEEFAKVLGLTSVTISNLENGQHVGPKSLRALSKHLGIGTKQLRRLMLTDEDNE